MGLDCRPKLGRNEAMICRLGMSYNPCHEQDNQVVDRSRDGSVSRLCDLLFDGSRSIPLRSLHGVSRTNGLCHGCGDHPPGGTTHGWRHSLRQDLVRRHRQRRLLAKFAQKCHVQVVAASRQRPKFWRNGALYPPRFRALFQVRFNARSDVTVFTLARAYIRVVFSDAVAFSLFRRLKLVLQPAPIPFYSYTDQHVVLLSQTNA